MGRYIVGQGQSFTGKGSVTWARVVSLLGMGSVTDGQG